MKYDIGLLHLSFDLSTPQVADLKYQQQWHTHFIMDKTSGDKRY